MVNQSLKNKKIIISAGASGIGLGYCKSMSFKRSNCLSL
jgi:NAD(P)-dependent dehydrogenase (short-subunit alcohol dehydrogenase family)